MSSGLLTGLLAAPDMSEWGRMVAVDEFEEVDSTERAVAVELVEAFETTRDAGCAVGASVCALFPGLGLD